MNNKEILNEYGLLPYTSNQLKNWSNSKKIELYTGRDSYLSFIKNALNKKNLSKKIYFGMINNDLSHKIKFATNLNLKNFNVSISANEIRKILINSHGDNVRESLRGQIPITYDILLKAPWIISNADSVELSQKQFNGNSVLIFKKDIQQKTTVVSYISTSKHDLAILTMYASKKGTAAIPTDD